MVSGLFVPSLAALYTKKPNTLAALFAMILGGTTTISLILAKINLPFNLDANIFGISVSFLSYLIVNSFTKNARKK